MGGFEKFGAFTNEGHSIVAPSYETVPEEPVFKSRQHTAIAGETTFFDIEITSEIKLKKGSYHIINLADVAEGDYIEFSIVDKNDVLGLFSTYGLTVGVDVLEIIKFVRTEYIINNGYAQGYNAFGDDIYGAFDVMEGLFFRIAYNSVAESGANDIRLVTRLLWYE